MAIHIIATLMERRLTAPWAVDHSLHAVTYFIDYSGFFPFD